MSAVVTSRVVRYGGTGEPDLYGHVVRVTWYRVNWSVTEGIDGRVLATGHTWTKDGARRDAVFAANSPAVLSTVRAGGERRA